MNSNPVGWFEIYVQDMGRAKAFYESAFQVKLEKSGPPEIEMWAFPLDMQKTGASGALLRMSGSTSGGNSIPIYFSCVDCTVE